MPQVTTIPRQTKDRVLGVSWLGPRFHVGRRSETGRVDEKVDRKADQLRKSFVINALKQRDGAEERT
jgi:hypothetical protein